MAKNVYSGFSLPDSVILDVYRFRGSDREFVGSMSFLEFRKLSKETGWIYRSYQKGFCE